MRSFYVSNKDPSRSCVPNSELGSEKAIYKGDRAPSEAVFGRAVIPTAAAIVYAGLAAGFLVEKGCP